MKLLKIFVLLLFAVVYVLPLGFPSSVASEVSAAPPAEAPTGFDDRTNGFVSQSQFEEDLEEFAEHEGIEKGLGPVYNAQSCAECHQNPRTGGISQITELRAGHRNIFGNFVEAPGGSLINDRALDPLVQERVPARETIRTLRTSLNTLGDGFIEAISNYTLIALAVAQAAETGGRIAGQVIWVPVLEDGGTLRVGRFGWKNQHASLLSFSADAYLNEMGITSPLQPTENTSLGRPVADYDTVPDPENDGDNLESFARFMRATKAPPRDEDLAATPGAQAGSQLFSQTGCAICHVRAIVTAPPGTLINGGTFTVPPALGNQTIHPFSDYLLHDVGTGDGIVQNGGQQTANKLRTAPLWGVRTRTRLMHDGKSLTFHEAILRHAGEASYVIDNYRRLSYLQQQQIIAFLKSL